MKRRIIKKPKSSVQKRAIEQLRQTRARINKNNPQLLERFSSLLGANIPQAGSHQKEQTIEIDRDKNLLAVMTFLENKKSFSPEFQNKLKDILQEKYNSP